MHFRLVTDLDIDIEDCTDRTMIGCFHFCPPVVQLFTLHILRNAPPENTIRVRRRASFFARIVGI